MPSGSFRYDTGHNIDAGLSPGLPTDTLHKILGSFQGELMGPNYVHLDSPHYLVAPLHAVYRPAVHYRYPILNKHLLVYILPMVPPSHHDHLCIDNNIDLISHSAL